MMRENYKTRIPKKKMQNRECESEDARDSSEELRGVAPPTPIDNEGVLITPREKVDANKVDESDPTLITTLTITIVSLNIREFL